MIFPTFQYAPHPWWKWDATRKFCRVGRPVLRRLYPIEIDDNPPETPDAMAQWMHVWKLGGADCLLSETTEAITDRLATIAATSATPTATTRSGEAHKSKNLEPHEPDGRIRLCAEWEPVSQVLMTWPIWYPPLWSYYRELARAIGPSSTVTILVPTAMLGAAALTYLADVGGNTDTEVNTRIEVCPCNDIWVRDFGPITGYRQDGHLGALDAIYDPPPKMPFDLDDPMPTRWGTANGIAVAALNLHLEGGNLWSDGHGNHITSTRAVRVNGGIERITDELARVCVTERVHVLPELPGEATGHVDLLTKPLTPDLLAWSDVTHPKHRRYGSDLHQAVRRLRSPSGSPTELLSLPAPPPRRNLGVIPIWPTYCNALTVNGRLIVPTYGCNSDDIALSRLTDAVPHLQVVPVDSQKIVNAGGSVHCTALQIHGPPQTEKS